MTKQNKAVPILLIAPAGACFQQASLQMAAAFLSHLYQRLTGKKKYYDYKIVRNKLDFEDGIIAESGVLAGWSVKEFASEQDLRDYMFNYLQYPNHQGIREEEKKGIKDEENNRIIDVNVSQPLADRQGNQNNPNHQGIKDLGWNISDEEFDRFFGIN